MTIIEKVMSEHADQVMDDVICDYCPSEFGYKNDENDEHNGCDGCCIDDCKACWNRQIEGTEESSDESKSIIKDSGDRTEFETGAKHDMHAGKGRMDLLPWYGIMEVSKHCEEGALKYGEHNVDKGIPLHSLLDSASRHLAKYMVGMDDEDHLRAACWNLLWALNQRVTHPELDDRFSTKCNLEFLEKHLVVKPLDIVRIKCLQCGDTHRVPKEVWNNAPHLHDSYMKLSYCPICKKTVAHGIVEEVKSDE